MVKERKQVSLLLGSGKTLLMKRKFHEEGAKMSREANRAERALSLYLKHGVEFEYSQSGSVALQSCVRVLYDQGWGDCLVRSLQYLPSTFFLRRVWEAVALVDPDSAVSAAGDALKRCVPRLLQELCARYFGM